MGKTAEIILHQDYMPLFQMLSPEQLEELVSALFKYQGGEDVEDLSQAVGIVFHVITERAAREKESYEKISATRSSNRKGKQEQSTTNDNKTEQTQTNENKTQQTQTKRDKPKPNPIPNPILPTEVGGGRKAPTPRPAPTLEEVKAYAAERKSKVNPESFFLYHQGIGWKKGNNPISDWKAVFQQWEVTEFDKGNPIRAVPVKKNSFHFEGERKTDYDAILREEQLALAEQIRAAGGEP